VSKPILGLLGGMGSGKSWVAAQLVQRGGRLISGDALGHEALVQPDIRQRVIERFGTEISDNAGKINRRQLGRKVFADAAERKSLEAIVFPWIESRIREEIEAARNDKRAAFVVLDAAIMLETGWNNVCDWLVYIDVPREIRLARLAEQRGWTEKEGAARESAQMPLNEKKNRAEFVIDNSGTTAATVRQIDDLLARCGIGELRDFPETSSPGPGSINQ